VVFTGRYRLQVRVRRASLFFLVAGTVRVDRCVADDASESRRDSAKDDYMSSSRRGARYSREFRGRLLVPTVGVADFGGQCWRSRLVYLR
jgi:hypothetical protein